jgi:hypothetical protein
VVEAASNYGKEGSYNYELRRFGTTAAEELEIQS